MSIIMKKKASIITVVLLFTLLLLIGCSSTSQNTITQEEKEKQETEKMKTELQNYAQSHNINDANVMFFNDFNNEFTIKLQSKYQGKNIVFYSNVSDIYKENGKNYIVLNQWFEDCIFILECSDSTVEAILYSGLTYDSYGYGNEEVIVLANIETIERIHYKVSASGNNVDGYEVYLDNNNVTEIKGKCIAIKISGN